MPVIPTNEDGALGLHGKRFEDRCVEVYRCNRQPRDMWVGRRTGWHVERHHGEDQRTDELQDRWVHTKCERLLAKDWYVIEASPRA